jgi:hypothetical protein
MKQVRFQGLKYDTVIFTTPRDTNGEVTDMVSTKHTSYMTGSRTLHQHRSTNGRHEANKATIQRHELTVPSYTNENLTARTTNTEQQGKDYKRSYHEKTRVNKKNTPPYNN